MVGEKDGTTCEVDNDGTKVLEGIVGLVVGIFEGSLVEVIKKLDGETLGANVGVSIGVEVAIIRNLF